MLKFYIKYLLIAGLSVFSLSGLVMANGSKMAMGKDKVISFPTAKLQWKTLEGGGGIKYANLVGDIFGKGYYEAFVLFPSKLDNPFHNHSKDISTVVLKGTFYSVINNKRVEYPAGSYYFIPAGLDHYSGCSSKEDCLLYQFQDDNFDIVTKP